MTAPLTMTPVDYLAVLQSWRPSSMNALVDAPSRLPGIPGARRMTSATATDGDFAPIIVERIAILNCTGFLSKTGQYGGTSTSMLRTQLAEISTDPNVEAVILFCDSPGGSVAGTDELARDIRGFRKPVYVYAEDLLASAAFWIASGARSISCNRLAQVGSIGVFAVATDESELYRKQGIRVHVVASGPRKGEGIEGTPLSGAYLESIKTTVDAMFDAFKESVLARRRIAPENLSTVLSGETWMSSRAAELGLVDHIESLGDLLARVSKDFAATRGRQRLAQGL